jgi:hypothetical protein
VAEHQEVHGAFTCAGPIGKLAGELFHYTYPTIYSYVEKLNDYTSLHVSNKLRDGHGGAAQRVPLAKLLLSPLSHFLRMFIVNKGYKDGMHGFILAGYSAFYTFLLYAKMWEYGLRQSDGAGLPPITNAQVTHARRKYAPFAEI